MIFIGSGGIHPTRHSFTSSLLYPAHQGLMPHQLGATAAMYVGYDTGTDRWRVRVSAGEFRAITEGAEPIENLTFVDFEITLAARRAASWGGATASWRPTTTATASSISSSPTATGFPLPQRSAPALQEPGGARLFLVARGVTQLREQVDGMHWRSQNHRRVHFGLGPNTVVDSLAIIWPSGAVQMLEQLPADRVIRVIESPTECSDGIDDDGDKLVDLPGDPGCEDPLDDSESSPPPAHRTRSPRRR